MDGQFIVSSSPHIRTPRNTRRLMLDVIIALIPALIAAVIVFGWRALSVTVVSVVFSVFFEWAYRKMVKKSCNVGDLSAVITGILLAYCLPATIPYWMVVVGDLFAIVLVKQLFGGIGKNFMNPALAGRAFMFSWAVAMSTWIAPMATQKAAVFKMSVDAVSSATPLSFMANGMLPEGTSIMQMFLGNVGGCIGETSALALLIGGVYLWLRKVISPRIPLCYIITVAVLTFAFPQGNNNLTWMLSSIFSGGLMLGAIFMATDYTTSPVTKRGQLLFGICCGLLTVFIRYFGSFVEGVSYSILLMNICVWFLDKTSAGIRFGVSKEDIKKARLAKKAAQKAEKEAAV